MQIRQHDLPGQVPGSFFRFHSYHFGTPGSGPHVYLQAGLHADELPGILLLHRLRSSLEKLEQQGALQGSITLVPMANPAGLNQFQHGQHQGRFDAVSGENFNRLYPQLAEQALPLLQGTDSAAVKAALQQALQQQQATTPLESLRHELLAMALAADIVLDVHCDSEALLHLYGNTRHQSELAELAGFMQAGATLLCEEAGGMSFDDAVIQNWRRMEALCGQALVIPLALTLELRGVADVSDGLAARDEAALLAWLCWRGVIAGERVAPVAAPWPATQLAATEILCAPVGGVVVYQAQPGQQLLAGARIGYVLDPLTGESHVLQTRFGGMFFARVAGRLATQGAELAYIAGQGEVRRGQLLSA